MAHTDLKTDSNYIPGTLIEHEKTVSRRSIFWAGWLGFWVLVTMWGVAVVRYLFPKVTYEPSDIFKAGKPADYPIGSVTLIKTRKVWIVREKDHIYAFIAVCTHLSCQPVWLEESQTFRCPCHGGQFDKKGVNFAGPPPKPLERPHIELTAEGDLLVDKSIIVANDFILPV